MLEKYAALSVMKEVLMNAATRYSVTEAAKRAKVSVFAAKHALDYLYAKKMITLEKVGRTYQYKTDLGSYLARQWKLVFSVEELHDSAIVENILKLTKKTFNIVVYGSVGQGTDDELSDIDLLVISDADFETRKKILACSGLSKREMNIKIYSPDEWRKKAVADKVFYENAIINSISLYGEKPVVL